MNKTILYYLVGIWSCFIGLKMFYFQTLCHFFDKPIYPYWFGNYFIDWIPLTVLGGLTLSFSFMKLYRRIKNE